MTGKSAGPAPEKNGDMFQAPPRRDNVSPFLQPRRVLNKPRIPRPELRDWNPPQFGLRRTTPASGGHGPDEGFAARWRCCLPSLRDSWLEGYGGSLKWWAIFFLPYGTWLR